MQELFRLALVTRALPVWLRFATTAVLVLAVLAIHMATGEVLRGYPFLPFVPVVILTGLVFDRGNGIFATLASALLAVYYLVPPYYSLDIGEPGDFAGLLLFLAIGIVAAILVESLHVAFVELARRHKEIDAAANQRAVLLRELSHRMRNDLAALAALLVAQSRAASVDEARSALASAADRVTVLARVHQRLTMLEGEAVIDTREYLTDLCDDLRIALTGLRPIRLDVAAESHPVGLQRAVALGLMANELVTNALKYAFSETQAGRVEVRFERRGAEFRLAVSDNGEGGPAPAAGTGTGHKLVRALAAQLGGRLERREGRPGSVYSVTFPAGSGELAPPVTASDRDAAAP
jgi:two-component sensor histidine kinase